ncbi:MAG: aspartate kinase [Ponticaulis sp.]|nr:aspartate kinase [Ponticaulis sp.]|tara:strand:+ start:141799 stop:143052 length:1254 start_codon:yes stop_codon:yes gene_type:complete
MSPIVMKFGGTSVADLDRINHVADMVAAQAKESPGGVAVIVSAMAGETNRLVGLANGAAGSDLVGEAFDDEYDVIVSSGEQVTSGLLALALRRRGMKARSWLGWQMPMLTNQVHGKARIEDIEGNGFPEAIATGEIAVVAGFQGRTEDGRITTLGRGGSDTSAVAVAAALKAERCDIYTDVDGVYTTDPRIVSKARRIDRISYEEMLEMASLGAKVLQTRSVELAMNHGVPIRVLSSMAEPGQDNSGTLVCDEDEIMEKQVVSGIAYSRDEAKVSLLGVSNHPGIAADIFARLARSNINVDMIVQADSRGPELANMVFTCTERDSDLALSVLSEAKDQIGYDRIIVDKNVAKVSVVGVGMRSHTGVAEAMFDALSSKGINIQVISTSEIKISVLIDASYTELAVRALHSAYGLDAVG